MKECAEGCLYVHNNEGMLQVWVPTKASWAKKSPCVLKIPSSTKKMREIISQQEKSEEQSEVYTAAQIWQKHSTSPFTTTLSRMILNVVLLRALVMREIRKRVPIVRSTHVPINVVKVEKNHFRLG